METTTQDGLIIVSSDPQPEPPETEEGAPLPEEDGSPADSPPAPEAPEEDDQPLSGKAFRRFVDRQTRQQRDLERKLAERDGQIDMLLKMARGDAPPPPQAEPPGPPRRPRQSEFTTWEEYEAADNAFIRQAIAYEQEQQTQHQRSQSFAQQQQELERERLKAIETREQEVRRQHPDYDDRLQTLLPTITQGVLEALKMSGADGPDLVLYLASHADDVERLNNTPWHDLGRELGKLAGASSRRRANGQQGAPNRLPEPPQPVGGGGATANPGYRDDMTQAQFDAWVKRTYPEMPYTHRR